MLELPCRKLCELDGLVELRRLHSRPILGSSSVCIVRQLRFRKVPIVDGSGIMHELPIRNILACERINSVDGVQFVRCGDVRD